MITLPELTIYISHTCDLACDKCFTYNNLNWGKHFRKDDSVNVLKDAVDFNEIFLLGGEPLLNPHLLEWMTWVEQLWPDSNKWIVTNGRQLDKLPSNWENNWKLEISAHSVTDLQTILDWADNNSITYSKFYNDRHTDAKWHYRLLLGDTVVGELSEAWHFFDTPVILENNKPIRWTKLHNKEEQHNICPAKECMHLLNGRFYRCPQQAILPQLSSKFKIEEPFKSIAEDDVGCDPKEFLEWVTSKDVPQAQCQLCNWSQKIKLPVKSKVKKIKVTQL